MLADSEPGRLSRPGPARVFPEESERQPQARKRPECAAPQEPWPGCGSYRIFREDRRRLLRCALSRLLVISHPAVLAGNQLPYAALRAHGWDPWLVVPNRWIHDYASEPFGPETLPELAGRVSGLRVVLPGRVQHHLYVANVARVIDAVRPAIAFLEEEPTALPTYQWGRVLHRARIPFGVQADENLTRPYSFPQRLARSWCYDHAAFVAARSPTAARRVNEVAPHLPTPVVPHHVPEWTTVQRASGNRPFTVGYAGRLVPEKGLDDLVDAVEGMSGSRLLRIVGSGPLLGHLAERSRRGARIELVTDIGHDDMAQAYSDMDVLVLPSRTTETWAEQFGRVLVEALWCGVPVVGSDSGEIPWVIQTTGGGLVFREGDVCDLRRALEELRADPARRHALAMAGRQAVREQFAVPAVALALDKALRDAMTPAQRGHGAFDGG